MREAIVKIWLDLTTAQRIAVVASGVLTVVAVGALVTWASRPTYAVLFSGMTPGDASEVVDGLAKAGVPYRVANGGTTVSVPTDRLAEARLRLAGEGLPATSAVGFEIFDESKFPGTEFRNNINYQRALQGELARTIEALDEVRAARVHLALPRPRLYTEDEQPPKASVVLHLARGRRLSHAQVQAVTHLVASAVDGLEPQQVTIVEAAGTILSAEGPPGADTFSSSQTAATAQFEADLRRRLQALLDSALGAGKAIVEVSAVLDFDQEETVSDTYEPTGAQRGTAREHTAEEKYDASGAAVGGPPGVTSNILSPVAAASTATTGGTFESRVETREYQLSTERRTIRKAVGGLKRLCVSVIVDSEVPRSSLTAIQEAVRTAAGIDESRGDELAVVPLSVEAGKLLAKQTEADAEAFRSQHVAKLVHAGIANGALLLALVAAVGAAVWVWKRTSGARAEVAEVRAGPDAHADLAPLELVPPLAQPEERQPGQSDEIEPPEPAAQPDHVEALRELAREDPDRVASQLRDWVRASGTGA